MDQKFIDLFKETIEYDGEIAASDEFRNFDEWDSLTLLSVIAMVDEEYGVIIESNAFSKLQTVEDIYTYIQSKSE